MPALFTKRIDPPVFDQSRARDVGKTIRVCQIGRDRLHASLQPRRLLPELRQGGGVAVHGGDVMTRLDQAHGHRQADAARGAGDNHCAVLRRHLRFLLRCDRWRASPSNHDNGTDESWS